MDVKVNVLSISPLWLRKYAERIEASPLGYRLAKGVFWSLAGVLISRAFMLAASVGVARILGKKGFGELGIIQATVGMFGALAGFGLGLTATKHVAEFRHREPQRAGGVIRLSGIVAFISGGMMSLCLVIFAPWLAENSISAPHLASALQIGAVVLFISALTGAQTGALSGFEAFKAIAHINLLSGLSSFPILIGGAYLGGLTGTVWALAINLTVNWLLNHLVLKREAKRFGVPLSSDNWRSELPVLWRFSLPAVLGSILLAPANWACGALLVNQPDGYAEMGIYNAAKQWQLAILFIPGILAQVILPLLSNLNTESKVLQYQKILKFNIFLNAGIALIVIVPLFFFANLIMSVYGPGFERGLDVLRILALSAVLVAVNNVIGQGIASKGRMWTGFLFNALWAMALLGTTWIFIRLGFGGIGLAYATLIAYAFHTVWQGLYLIRENSRDKKHYTIPQ